MQRSAGVKQEVRQNIVKRNGSDLSEGTVPSLPRNLQQNGKAYIPTTNFLVSTPKKTTTKVKAKLSPALP
jgi:hypothetical protein